MVAAVATLFLGERIRSSVEVACGEIAGVAGYDLGRLLS
jgi:hypothetical protein